MKSGGSNNQEDEGKKASRTKKSGEIMPSSPKCSTEPLFSSSFDLHHDNDEQNETTVARGSETGDQHESAENMNESNGSGAVPRKKRKFDEASSGLVHEASACSRTSGAMQKEPHATSSEEVVGPPSASQASALRTEEEEAEEAGLSLLFAASLMQQNENNEDADDDDDDDDGVDPNGLLSMMSNITSLTSPAFPLLSTDVATAPRSTAVACLPVAPSQPPPQTSVSPIPIAAAGPPPTARAEEDTITEPTQYDVLCGRGGGINKHVGNIMYRRVVDHNKAVYKRVPKRHRMLVSQSIVQAILNQGGRFLQQQSSQNEWKDIPFRRAVQKTSQALREQKNEDRSEASAPADAELESEDSLDTRKPAANDDDGEELPPSSEQN